MNPLDSLAAWLATYAVHSTLLLGAAWLVGRTGRRNDGTSHPAVTSLIWKVALVGGIVTASVQSALDLRPAGSFALAPAPVTATGGWDGRDGSDGSVDPVDRLVTEMTGSTTAADPTAAGTQSGLETGAPPARALPSLATIAILAWVGLAALSLLWYAGRRLILLGRLGDRRMVAEGPLPQLLDELRRGAGVRRPIRLTASATISSPVALGASEICLPAAALVELEPEQQRAMLAHELAHLVRRDPQWLALACLVERAFFFQPLNRMARSRLQHTAEILADEWAAGHSGRVPLARCLVKVAEWIQASPLGVPVAGMAEERSQLSNRVVRLLESAGPGRGLPRWAAGTIAAAALVAIVAFAPGASGAARGSLPEAIPEEDPAMDLDWAGQEPVQGRQPTANPAPTGRGPKVKLEGADITTSIRVNPAPHPSPKTGSGDTQDTTVVKALIARLRDEDAGVRQAAANALGRIANPMAIPELVRTLDDPDRDVRHAALDALSNFERGVPAAPIRKLLGADDPDVRSQAASMLGDMRDRESVAAISRLVRDPDADVRQQAIDALTDIEDPSAGPAILTALTDASPDVRHGAFHALEHLKVPVTAAQVTRGLRDEHADVRVAAVELAAERRMTDVVPDLIRLLEDNSADVRVSAAEALSEMASDPARAALRTAMTHRDPKVRRVAVEYFGEENEQ